MKVFISHSSKDKAQFSSIALALKGAGVDCWDPVLMEPGGHLATQLRRAVAECGVCIFVATKKSVESRWCLAELGAFWGANKRVIVYLADGDVAEVDIPVQFQGNLWTDDALVVLETIQRLAAEKQAQVSDAQLRRACCRILSRNEGGGVRQTSGFVVGEKLVATVDDIEKSDDIQVQFGDSRYDVSNHFANGVGYRATILELSSSPKVESTPVAVAVEGMTKCLGFGFPRKAAFGFPFSGEVLASDVQKDESGETFTVLSSPSLANLDQGYLSGLGGAPVWASGAVLGLIHSMDSKFGIFYLTPAECLLHLIERAN